MNLEVPLNPSDKKENTQNANNPNNVSNVVIVKPTNVEASNKEKAAENYVLFKFIIFLN